MTLYLGSTLSDYASTLRDDYAQQMIQLRRTESIGSEKDWPNRTSASAAMRTAYENRLWAAESEGVAIANLSDWITNAGREAGLERLQIKVEVTRPKDMPPSYRRLAATVNSQESEAALYAMLERIEKSPHLLVFERLQIQQRPVPHFEATLVAYAKIETPAGAKK